MEISNQKLGGLLIAIASTQLILLLIAAEALYPGYNISSSFISSLSIGSTGSIFGVSLFLFGLLVLLSGYFLRTFRDVLINAAVAVIGVAAIGASVFPVNSGIPHVFFSSILFVFGGIAAIGSFRIEKPPLSYFSVLLGFITLASFILFAFTNYSFGLGSGGLENLMAYPPLIWALLLGGYLMNSESGSASRARRRRR